MGLGYMFYGFRNKLTGEWLDNDFQSPHFPTIAALIAACYESETEFAAQHGDPEIWEKREISTEEIISYLTGGSQ